MAMTPSQTLQHLIDGKELLEAEMVQIMRAIMGGELPGPMVAALLVALRSKKETPTEIAAAATVMRDFATAVDVKDKTHLVDVVGTGGDGAHTFNISTASMFVASAAGAKIAKHGNRSVSSKSGSADVLEALGVKLNLSAAAVSQCIEQLGIGFMFAPNHHPAMKNVVPVRKDLGVRTIFNILGPLTNPAKAPNIVMGVFHPELVATQAKVLQLMGAEHALVVHGNDGLDEITLSGPTMVAELRKGQINQYEIKPSDFGIPHASMDTLKVADAQESKAIILNIMNNQSGPARNIVCLNAGATLYAANVSPSIADGIELADSTIASGKAKQKLEAFVALTQSLAS
ncbi:MULTISPECIES: anthranilate phosphoribosyltransferase [unclassified Polynucleobacter]|uniref:anthranilate phosphoribosyltransferase n=1 Tax=unclassified Polynucleobacter TaxID=2640945 RepID=UPI002572A146|nr:MULTISPECIES: anthranilate phosphoribosyltransferase [unclassified Polynucleobacter]BEI34612.1 anthranilate phosphoribosyltransferase [Polynucleobacter sp. HIN6]BEI40198.1 anthranilate phosphoribosyltransferase [Polynucleobacter sp. HIN9]BEI41980.1 anthranilate phosphoribosyltransferase [Polynucleobacter sp. HIN10]BEI43757.1 anthranilate phosphoribosyltransferase [Polynucleobacter sp. HIN11]